MHITITEKDRETMGQLAARWAKDYAAASEEKRKEMTQHAEDVYEGTEYSNSLIGAVRQGWPPSPADYAVVRGQGERGFYICRDPEYGDMYVTIWDTKADTGEDLSFSELDIVG